MDRSVRTIVEELDSTGGQTTWKRDATLSLSTVKQPIRRVIELAADSVEVPIAIGTVCYWSLLSLKIDGTGSRVPFKWNLSSGAGGRSGNVLEAREHASASTVAARTSATLYLFNDGSNLAQVELEYIPVVT